MVKYDVYALLLFNNRVVYQLFFLKSCIEPEINIHLTK